MDAASSDPDISRRAPTRPAPTRRAMLAGTVAGTAGLTIGAGSLSAAAASRPRTGLPPDARTHVARSNAAGHGLDNPSRDFVTVRNGQFHVGRNPLRFGGTNTYYLHQQSHYMIDARSTTPPHVPGRGAGLGVRRRLRQRLHATAARALRLRRRRVRLARLHNLQGRPAWPAAGARAVNNWPDYGGMAQYVKWFLGLPDDSFTTGVNHDLFYSTPPDHAGAIRRTRST